jgi:GAF domain-containing protein
MNPTVTYPDFVDNETFFAMDDSHTGLELALRLSENLKKIHYLTIASYQNFDELILKYLNTGIEIFNMKIGIVSKIKDDRYLICNAMTPDGSLKKGDIFPLEGTYCWEVCISGEILGFPHVGIMDEMKDHPVYQNMKLESYLSAPIYLNDALYGTLNFTSTEPREFGFSEHEKDLIGLMANSIGSFLALR